MPVTLLDDQGVFRIFENHYNEHDRADHDGSFQDDPFHLDLNVVSELQDYELLADCSEEPSGSEEHHDGDELHIAADFDQLVDCHLAVFIELFRFRISEQLVLVSKCLPINFLLQSQERADQVVDIQNQVQHDQAEQYCQYHLILFSLVDALLPDVELQVRLLPAGTLSEGLDVQQKPLLDALQLGNVHVEKRREGLGQ